MPNAIRWLSVLLLLCWSATAMAQSVSAGVSASAQEEGAVSASVSSAYSAGSNPSGARVIGSSSSGRSAYVRDRVRVLARKEKPTANGHAELISHFGYSSATDVLRDKAHSVTTASKDKQMKGNEKKDQPADSDTEGSSESLPDSTRETGVVNPPDMGTTSPIEWNPGLSFGLPDFDDRTFLNPTLHVGGRSKKQLAADKLHPALKGGNPSLLVTSPLNEKPRSDISHQSGLQSSILDPLGQQ